MKDIRNMSIEEIKKDVERIKNDFPQLASSCDAINFDRPKGAIKREYKYLLKEVEECNDSDLQDYYKFVECQNKLDSLKYEFSHYWECGVSNFGEAMATDKEVAEKEYNALGKAYSDLYDELYPIMKESYKGYKAHCKFCRINYFYCEEFEEADEDDLFASILGM